MRKLLKKYGFVALVSPVPAPGGSRACTSAGGGGTLGRRIHITRPRRRERKTQRFKIAGSAQKFLLTTPRSTNIQRQSPSRLRPNTPRAARRGDERVARGRRGGCADEESVTWYHRAIQLDRNYWIVDFNLAATLAELGQLDEARAKAQAGLALEPKFTLRRYRAGAGD
jgi:tetratricopeptide (TPR) repeat protein